MEQTAQQESQTFAEKALRLSGKTEAEAKSLGAVDRADEQVETLFAPRYQTTQSPVHRVVWDGIPSLDEFMPPVLPESAPCDTAMEKSLAVVRRRRQEKSLHNADNKLSEETIAELAQAGYWGMLIDPRYGGQGAPFTRFIRFLMRMSVLDSMAAGMASVHGCIGGVDPLRTFGSPEQKQRLLPLLARGEKISAFALTEPWAGSDLTALRTTAKLVGDHYEVTGEKLFITNVVPGRLVGLVVLLEGKPAVMIAELPEEGEQFQFVRYGLYALKHAYNRGLRFNRFRVPRENLLLPPRGDGLTIAYHGLNLGRLSLCASAAGSMRVMLANMLPWTAFRKSYGQPIRMRELVKSRIARLAGLIAGADAVASWGARLIDEGYRGELECIIAKIFGSEAQKEAAVELFMKTHGGRSFLHGHLFGDNVHEYLAPCIYEGEGQMLGLAFFKSLVKQHGQQFFEPIANALQKHGIRRFNPANPIHAWKLRRELGAYTRWMVGQRMRRNATQIPVNLDAKLGDHVDFALKMCRVIAGELSAAMRKHQLALADRQCRMSILSQRGQNVIQMIVTSLWAHQQGTEVARAAADVLCQDLRRQLTGERVSDSSLRDAARLADMVIDGAFTDLTEVPVEDILMRYENK